VAAKSDNSSGGSYQLLLVNSLTLGIPASEVLTVVEWAQPTPLPFAPESVLGVVSVLGRMYTVVDITKLLDKPINRTTSFIVALSGDEQLALAIDEAGEVIEVNQTEEDSASSLIRQRINFDGREISLLNTNMLFPEIIRGRERRRRGL
jgi:chemotaxis signal transduction protein